MLNRFSHDTLTVRVIPCLDVNAGRVVKGVNFVNLRDAGDPVELAARYSEAGADEITFLDVSASVEGRATMADVVASCASQIFVPLTVGGGIRSVDDVDRLLQSGADKVSVNTAAIASPDLIDAIAARFGSQVLVLSADARRISPDSSFADAPGSASSGFEVTTHGGKRSAHLDLLSWVSQAVDRGVGEVLLNSMDADGTREGFDIEMLRAVRDVCRVPLIASGGAGCADDFVAAAGAGADAVLGASVFHFGDVSIAEVKTALVTNGFAVR